MSVCFRLFRSRTQKKKARPASRPAHDIVPTTRPAIDPFERPATDGANVDIRVVTGTLDVAGGIATAWEEPPGEAVEAIGGVVVVVKRLASILR